MLESAKSSQAFRTISEVSDDLGVPQHVLRFWETKFSAIRPLKRGGNRRYYRPEDIQLLRAVNKLLYTDGYTIRGVQKLIREQGVRDLAAQHGGVMPALADTLIDSASDKASDITASDDTTVPSQVPVIDGKLTNTPTMEFEPLPETATAAVNIQPSLYLPLADRPDQNNGIKSSGDVSDAIARLQAVRTQIQNALGHPVEQVA